MSYRHLLSSSIPADLAYHLVFAGMAGLCSYHGQYFAPSNSLVVVASSETATEIPLTNCLSAYCY